MLLADEPAADRIPVELKLSLPIGGELIHDVSSQAGKSLKVAIARRPGMASGGAGTAHCGLAATRGPRFSQFPTPDPEIPPMTHMNRRDLWTGAAALGLAGLLPCAPTPAA